MSDKELMELAIAARERAYAPYSRFLVGAALLCSNGTVYTGCNIENAAYTPTNCAERTAFFKAVSEGERDFVAIAVAGGKAGELTLCTPCGVCRQVMTEFCRPNFRVIMGDGVGVFSATLADLLPMAFSPADVLEGDV